MSGSDWSDGTITRRVRELGCTEAAGAFLVRNMGNLRKKVPAPHRDDLIQSAGRRFLQATKDGRVRAETPRALADFVYQTVRNRYIEELRRADRDAKALRLLGASFRPRDRVRSADCVPDDDRALHLVGRGLTHQQVGESLGMSTKAVESRLARIRQKILNS